MFLRSTHRLCGLIGALSLVCAAQATGGLLVDEGNGSLREIDYRQLNNERVRSWRVNVHLGSKEIFPDNQWGIIVASSPDQLAHQRFLRQRLYQNALPWISGLSKSQAYTMQTSNIAVMVDSRTSAATDLMATLESEALKLMPLYESVLGRFDAPTLKKHSSKPISRYFALYVKDLLSIFQALDELRARGGDAWGDSIEGEPTYQRAQTALAQAQKNQPALLKALNESPLSLEAPRPSPPPVRREETKTSSSKSSGPGAPQRPSSPSLSQIVDPINLDEAAKPLPKGAHLSDAPNPSSIPAGFQVGADGIPFGKALKPGFAISPFAPTDGQGKSQLVDVSGLNPGQTVKCPYTGKTFRVPPGAVTFGTTTPAAK